MEEIDIKLLIKIKCDESKRVIDMSDKCESKTEYNRPQGLMECD
jgi:hypothetical protein